jgi:Spy/CpxP family protein refolding chaperone
VTSRKLHNIETDNTGEITMRTKLIAGLSAAIITLSGAGFTLAHADSDERMEKRHEHRIENRIEHLTKELSLTTEQQVQLKEQMLSQQEKRGDKQKSRKDVFKQLQKLDPSAADYQTQLNSLVLQAQDQTKSMILEKAEQKAKLFEILTPEQEKEFIELQSEMGKKMSKRDADRDHGRHGDKKCH